MNISSAELNNEKIELTEDEVSMFGYNFDELGKVFSWHGRIFRGIYPNKIQEVKSLLECGLIDELIAKELFPRTNIAAIQLENFELVLEHEKISPVLYPASWSFEMLKDAALCVLEVNKIARKYGYQTIDSHGFNVLFKRSKPVFVDFGSFTKNTECPNGWLSYEMYIRYYLYPLKIFKSGNFYLGRAVMTQGKKIMTHSSYYQYRFPILRIFRPHFLDKIFDTWFRFKTFAHFPIDEVKKRAPSKLKGLLVFLKKKKWFYWQNVSISKLERKVNKIKLPFYASQWGDYHDQFVEESGIIKSSPRFDRIIEQIRNLKLNSVIEFGGNQGMFSELLESRTNIKQITCTDYDEVAVNKMYLRIKHKKLTITPTILDVVSPLVLSYGPSLAQRYKSDMVIALALTHHLILAQKVPISGIFEQFANFTNRYVVTEFMPMGLYGKNAKRVYECPQWYTLDWFKVEFEKYFTLLVCEKLEPNRILLIGEKKKIY